MIFKPSTVYLINGILVETTFFLYKTGESMLDTSMRPYIVETVCKHLNNNETVCLDLGSYTEQEDKVQSIAARFLMLYRLLVNIPAIILGLFCGAWSDKSGRKVPMVLPSLGSVLAVIVYMLSLANRTQAMAYIMVGAVFQGLFGKSSVITMAVNSYVADTSEKSDRTKRLGRLQAMNFFGLFVGSLLAGSLADTAGLETIMCVVVFVHGASIILTLVFIPESLQTASDETKNDTSDKKNLQHYKNSLISFCGVFKPTNFKESLLVLLKRREAQLRGIIAILVLTSIVNQTCKSGEIDVTVLFVGRRPLNWPKSWYGYMLALDYALMGLCLIIVLPIFSNVLLLNDVVIIIIALCFRIARLIWTSFSTQTWMVYLSVLIGAFGGLIASATRSLLSKSVNEDELGKTFAILASGETASKLLGTVIFANIYSGSAHFFSGFAFIIEAIVYALLLLVMVFFHKKVKQTDSYHILTNTSSSYWDIDRGSVSPSRDGIPPPEDINPEKRTVRFLHENIPESN